MNRRFRFTGVLLVVIAILMTALPLTAAAAPTITNPATSGTLTISKEGSTFDLYKLAVANLQTGADAYTYTAAGNYANFFTGSYELTDGGVGAITSNTAASQALATAAEKFVKDQSLSPDVSGVASGAATSLDIGYYLIVEKTTVNTSATVASKAMLVSIPEVSGSDWNFSVTATLKDSAGDITKKIVEGSDRVDASTAAIGEMIPYEIKTTVPDYDDSVVRSSITYKITDTMSKGLDYAGSLVVKQNSATLAADTDYTVSHTNNADGTETLELVFNFASIEDKGEITVTFNALLTADAVQTVAGGGASAGNPNDVRLTYTNNPQENDFYTKDDKVITYTTGVAVMKVDANDITKDLAGAEFTLNQGDKVVASYTYDSEGKPVITGGAATTDANGMIYFPGLDAGTYTLTETKAPEGYSILDKPLAIVITAGTDSGSGQPNGTFTCTVDGTAVNASTHPTTAGDKIFFNVQVSDEAGWTLPGTGGIGTTVFTIAGAALIALSGILLLIMLRKRSSKAK